MAFQDENVNMDELRGRDFVLEQMMALVEQALMFKEQDKNKEADY